MALEFRCGCGQPLLAPQEHAGAHAQCPTCGRATTIPWAFGCDCGRVSLLFSLPAAVATCPLCGRTMRRMRAEAPPPVPAPPAPAAAQQSRARTRRKPIVIAACAAGAILLVAVAVGRGRGAAVAARPGTPSAPAESAGSPASAPADSPADGPAPAKPAASASSTPARPPAAAKPPVPASSGQPASPQAAAPAAPPTPAPPTTRSPIATRTIHEGPPKIGEMAPSLELDRWLAGQGKSSLDDCLGQYVVIHFLSPTCNPCAQSVNALSDLQAQFEKHGVLVIGVARLVDGEPSWSLPPGSPSAGVAVKRGDTPAAMNHFLHATKPAYPIAADKDGVTLKRYGVEPRETEWTLAPSGAITWRKHTLRGPKDESCFLVGRDGKLLWMGTGGDQSLADILVERIKADRKAK